MSLNNLTLTIAFCFFVNLPISAAILVRFEFLGEPGGQVTTPASGVLANLAASSLSRGDGLVANAPLSDTMTAEGWDLGTFDSTENTYFEFTLNPSMGYSMDVSSLDVSMFRSSAGAQSYALYTSLDSFAAAATNTVTLSTGAAQNLNFSFTDPSDYTGLESNLIVRLYGWDASGLTGGAAYLNNTFTVNGSVSPIPEFSGAPLLLGLSALALAVRRRGLCK